CHLHPIKLEGKEVLGYFFVDNKMTLEAEKASPFIAMIIMKMKELKKEENERKCFSSLEKLVQIAENFSGELDCLSILRHLKPFLTEVFKPKLIIVGAKKLNFIEAVAVKGEGSEPFGVSTSSDLSFLFGRNIVENNEHSKEFIDKFYLFFKIKPEKYVVSTVKFFGEKPELFIVVGSENKPSEESIVFLDRAAALFLFLRKIKEVEESEKNIVDCFNLVAKHLEILRKVFHSIDSGVLVLSTDGKIIFSNEQAENLLNITKVEKKEKVLMRSKEPGKTILSLVSRMVDEGKRIAAPFNVFEKILDVSVSEMEMGTFLVVCKDSTSFYKEMEERKHLFSLITHEVKNPLSSVLSASEMIYSERAGKFENLQQKKLSEIIYKNAQQMRIILDDVSLFGKSLFGSGGEKEVSINNLIEKILKEKEEIARAKEITIWKDLADVEMKCNPAMMETLLLNLIGNAFKYSFVKGNVGIRLTVLVNAVLLEVIDDGIGIPENDLERIGEPFFRAENVRENISGTGFGLSIVKNIVSRHRGEFKVLSPISEEDKIFIHSFFKNQRGTKFSLFFPVIGGENAKQNIDRR
ncbi:MAG: PAS domain-containing sensor histidine kinase, partial [Acidobacteria bacterium]|nr:PAS domain-containing sensor histidine kinase [Acidobacteriota bacterium]